MHFSITIALGLHFLLHHGVNSTQYSFLKNQTLSIVNDRNVLGTFIFEYIKMHMEIHNPRHVTIVGGSADELRQAQTLNSDYPFIMCADLTRCDYLKNFDSRNLFIVFLDDITEHTPKTNFSALSVCRNACLFLFVVQGMINKNDISTLLFDTVFQQMEYPELAYFNKGIVELYHFGLLKNCSAEVAVLLTWTPEIDLSKIYFPYFQRRPNLYGCPVTIGTFSTNPKMKVETDKNGSIIKISGPEGELVSLIAEALNFGLVVKYPVQPVDSEESLMESMLNEISSGNYEFGIGRLRLISGQRQKIQASKPYSDECLSLAIPRINGPTSNLVWAEFLWQVWVFIGLAFVLSCATVYIHDIMNAKKNENSSRQGFVSLFLDALAVNLGNPIIHVPASQRGRIILMMFILYVIVITTAYRTSLASILATAWSSSSIVDVEGIIKANLKVGGSRSNFNILKGLDSSNVTIQKLMERYEIIHDKSKCVHELTQHGNFAWLDLHSTFRDEKQLEIAYEELLTCDILDQCVLVYSSAVVFREGSFFRKPIDKVILAVVEAGFLEHWEQNFSASQKMSENPPPDSFSKLEMKKKFQNIFIFYLGCIFLCLLVFFIELLVAKFQRKKIKRERQRG